MKEITPYKIWKADCKRQKEVLSKINPITGKPKLTVIKGGLSDCKTEKAEG
jgi:hypothetical protein